MMSILRFISDTFRLLAGLLWMLLIFQPIWGILLVLLGGTLWFGGTSFFQHKPKPVAVSVEQAADSLAEQVITACPQPEKSLTKIFITPFDTDRNEVIENAVRKAFQRNAANGWYEVIDQSLVIQSLEKIHFTFISKDYPVALIEATGADLILTGKIDEFIPVENSHRIIGSFRLLDLSKKQEIFNRQFTEQPVKENAVLSPHNAGLRWVSVFIFTLIYPILMIPIIQRIIAKDNSGTNLAGMLGLALIPVGVAVLLTGILPTGAFSVIGYLVLFALSAAWVGFVMDKLAAR